MLKKLLFFFFFISISAIIFSQDIIIIKGSILSSEENSKILGARIYLYQDGTLITKSISNQNGDFFIKYPISYKGKFDLLIDRQGYLDYKILIDLTTIDFTSKKSISLKLNNNNKISLLPFKNSIVLDYSEKYVWSQPEFLLIPDEAFRIQMEKAMKESNNTTSGLIEKIDSAAIKIKDEKVINDVNLIFNDVKSLSKAKNYKAVIDKYAEAELLLVSLSNPKKKSVLLSQIASDKKKISKLKNSEDQVFYSQLSKARKNFDLGRKGYAKAKSILGTAPMKSRENDPELIDLIGKIDKMVSYYSVKDAAYILVKSKKKNQESIDYLKLALKEAESHILFMPPKEFPQLKKSIDSLQLILDPTFIIEKTPEVISSTTQNQGTTLLAPGEIYDGKTSDANKDLSAFEQYKKNQSLNANDKTKDYLDYEAYYNKIVVESITQDYQSEIKRREDEIQKINISIKNVNNDLELQIQKEGKMPTSPKPALTTPNNLMNEAGILYEKNKMTQENFKLKNTEGFVSLDICRRVVVDENGFGIVYDRTTNNEIGKSYYTRDGFPITEAIWLNESTGLNVIKN